MRHAVLGLIAACGLAGTAGADALRQVWRAEVGAGYSGAAVDGGRVYTMGNEAGRDVVRCLEADGGREVWKFEYGCALGANGYAGGPQATPAVHGGRVYTLSRDGHVHALDAATGANAWSVHASQFGASPPAWGFAGTPLVAGEVVVLNVGDAGLALRCADGRAAWSSSGGGAGYAPAVPLDVAGQPPAVALFAAAGLRAVDLKTGAVRWTHAWPTGSGVNAAAPLVFDGKVFISSGYDMGCALLDVSKGAPVELWRSKAMRNHFSTSVMAGGHIFGVDGNAGRRANLVCLQVASGKPAWTAPVGFGSVALAGGAVMLLDEGGTLGMLAADASAPKPLGTQQVVGGKCWTAPTVAGGRLYVRNESGDLACWALGAGR